MKRLPYASVLGQTDEEQETLRQAQLLGVRVEEIRGDDPNGWDDYYTIHWAEANKYFAWYDNQSDPTAEPTWEGAGWYEGTPEEAAKAAKADGCAWTSVCMTQTTSYPTPGTILARA